MAVWTVNTNADDGSVDTNSDSPTYRTGSLRGIIGAATNGDTIVFDNTGENPPFPDGVETSIALSDIITFDKVLTIDGGETWTENGALKTRVVLDGQSAISIMAQRSFSVGFVLRGLTFKNGAGATGLSSSSGLKFNGRETIIDHCVFDSCKSANGGAINANYTTFSSTISNCYFKNCEATVNGGAYYNYQAPNLTINNCTFDTCKANYGGALFFNNATTKTLNNCIFINCKATTSGASFFNQTSSVVNIIKCTFGSTTSNINISNSGDLIINDVISVDKISLDNGATVTFSGVDSVLAVTTTATIGSATFTAAENSTGYAALPSGTTAPTVGAGVKVCTYGAGITHAGYQYPNIVYTATNPSVPVLFETRVGDSGPWDTEATITSSPYSYETQSAFNGRLFDGNAFFSVSFDGIESYYEVSESYSVGYIVIGNTPVGYIQ